MHVVECLRPSADVAMPVLGTFRHQPGSLEDGDVTLHGGEGHRVRLRELGDGVLAVQCAGHDVAPGRIGERTQLAIEWF